MRFYTPTLLTALEMQGAALPPGQRLHGLTETKDVSPLSLLGRVHELLHVAVNLLSDAGCREHGGEQLRIERAVANIGRAVLADDTTFLHEDEQEIMRAVWDVLAPGEPFDASIVGGLRYVGPQHSYVRMRPADPRPIAAVVLPQTALVRVRDGDVRDGGVRDGDVRDGGVRDGDVRDGGVRDGVVRDEVVDGVQMQLPAKVLEKALHTITAATSLVLQRDHGAHDTYHTARPHWLHPRLWKEPVTPAYSTPVHLWHSVATVRQQQDERQALAISSLFNVAQAQLLEWQVALAKKEALFFCMMDGTVQPTLFTDAEMRASAVAASVLVEESGHDGWLAHAYRVVTRGYATEEHVPEESSTEPDMGSECFAKCLRLARLAVHAHAHMHAVKRTSHECIVELAARTVLGPEALERHGMVHDFSASQLLFVLLRAQRAALYWPESLLVRALDACAIDMTALLTAYRIDDRGKPPVLIASLIAAIRAEPERVPRSAADGLVDRVQKLVLGAAEQPLDTVHEIGLRLFRMPPTVLRNVMRESVVVSFAGLEPGQSRPAAGNWIQQEEAATFRLARATKACSTGLTMSGTGVVSGTAGAHAETSVWADDAYNVYQRMLPRDWTAQGEGEHDGEVEGEQEGKQEEGRKEEQEEQVKCVHSAGRGRTFRFHRPVLQYEIKEAERRMLAALSALR